MKKQREPKFKIGDRVTHPPNLYDETSGEIIEMTRVYAKINNDGSFVEGGLHTLESNLDSHSLPTRFDGETIEVDFPASKMGEWSRPAYTHVSKFKGWAYTVQGPEIRTLFFERRLSFLARPY